MNFDCIEWLFDCSIHFDLDETLAWNLRLLALARRISAFDRVAGCLQLVCLSCGFAFSSILILRDLRLLAILVASTARQTLWTSSSCPRPPAAWWARPCRRWGPDFQGAHCSWWYFSRLFWLHLLSFSDSSSSQTPLKSAKAPDPGHQDSSSSAAWAALTSDSTPRSTYWTYHLFRLCRRRCWSFGAMASSPMLALRLRFRSHLVPPLGWLWASQKRPCYLDWICLRNSLFGILQQIFGSSSGYSGRCRCRAQLSLQA